MATVPARPPARPPARLSLGALEAVPVAEFRGREEGRGES